MSENCCTSDIPPFVVKPHRPGRIHRSWLLFRAVQSLDCRVVESLLQEGVLINLRDRSGRSALHMCAKTMGSAFIMRRLLNAGSNIHAIDWDGNTALHCAVRTGDFLMVRYLIHAGADLHVRNILNQTPLDCIVLSDDWRFPDGPHITRVIRELLEAGADPNGSVRGDSLSLLHFAAMSCNEPVVTLLLDYGADANAKDEGDNTPLHWVATVHENNSHTDIMETLLKRGADVNYTNNNGYTVLQLLVYFTNKDVVQLFLKYGADVTVINSSDRKTMLHLACLNQDVEVLGVILNLGLIDIESKCLSGRTALHDSAEFASVDHLRLLLANGADMLARDEGGHSVIHFLSRSWEAAQEMVIHVIETVAMSEGRLGQQLLTENDREAMLKSPEIESYYQQCRAEVKAMQDRFLGNSSVRLWDMLMDKKNKTACYVRNEDLVKSFEDTVCETNFPIFENLLMIKFREAREHRNFMDKAAEELNSLLMCHLRFYDPRHLVIEEILKNLKQDEIQFVNN